MLRYGYLSIFLILGVLLTCASDALQPGPPLRLYHDIIKTNMNSIDEVVRKLNDSIDDEEMPHCCFDLRVPSLTRWFIEKRAIQVYLRRYKGLHLLKTHLWNLFGQALGRVKSERDSHYATPSRLTILDGTLREIGRLCPCLLYTSPSPRD